MKRQHLETQLGKERRRAMPRGVYDRSKVKDQRPAEKTVKAKAGRPKGSVAKTATAKVGRPKGSVNESKSSVNESKSSAKTEAVVDFGTKVTIVHDNISTIVTAMQGLVPVDGTASAVNLLDVELKANIEILSSLRREAFGLSDSEQKAEDERVKASEVEASSTEETDEEEVIEEEVEDSAPVAKPYPTQPQGMVPMPPSAGFPIVQ